MEGLKVKKKDDVGKQVEAIETSLRKREIKEGEMEEETMAMGGEV